MNAMKLPKQFAVENLSINKGLDYEGIARTQSPTNKNYTLELPTFGAIVGVSQSEVQWNGLILEEPPS